MLHTSYELFIGHNGLITALARLAQGDKPRFCTGEARGGRGLAMGNKLGRSQGEVSEELGSLEGVGEVGRGTVKVQI
jgi:hypothetical protein